jgi:hypothetical protein
MGVHIGDRGTAETPLHLTGTVRVGGSRHTARSDRGPVEAGAAVVVVGDDLGGLVVRPVEPGRETDRLPNHGRAVFATPEERAAAGAARDEASAARDWAAHRRTGTRTCAAAGALAAGAALWWLWARVAESGAPLAAGAVLAGAAWGAALFRFTDAALCRLDEGYRRLAPACGALGATGGAVAAALAVPVLGAGGLAVAALASLLCVALLPVALLLSGG